MIRRRTRIPAALAWLALVAAFSTGVWWTGYRAALDPLERRGASDLALASDRLVNQLQRFRELAVLLANHDEIRQVAASDRAADILLRVRDLTGSLDILVVGADGTERLSAIASAPEAHGGRGYFERAMDGALGVAHLRSPRWERRAFLFAAPIFAPEGPVRGAVVVAVDADAIEQTWRGDRPTVFFTDAGGTVFLSNRSELVGLARAGSGEGAPFVNSRARALGDSEIWSLDGGPYLPRTALHLERDLPVIGMVGEALIDVTPARQVATLQAAAAAALCLAFGAVLFWATGRRRVLAEANRRLEGRVQRRTAALSRLNADLRREVAERAAAEARLTKAQADLVQAGKLSALGQMSAGISHELNQPLMAIRSFAENGEAFLERGRPDAAATNLARIGELARRMGRIIRNLRAFARQESHPPVDVDLVAVIDTVLEMTAARARADGVALDWQRPAGPVMVRGGEVRLQQVFLNLVSNALDATAAADTRRVTLTVESAPGRVTLAVADTGPGIADPERIFDPFYSTKEVGEAEGMGLGLSISYGLVQGFGGAIRGRNRPGGGALFTVELDAAAPREVAA
ncbi:C4-dicarboxylate transport sensor protein [Oceanicola granulosus HTCC2516]|uniref:C4-dicarboxylate transport sensor protein DctB n=1 Tax=Oceanicola granulosus (strain ATCC BAA-861 / DSM 15982 / KCTC 12143 / HTCC2516) TaxID=314256 RepID=Q2CG32_OCEGH|nr:ATP-binding protein [Oceanicola granulosus]EAR51697.1 C4-dicarboxylate transport sensor protein [Oceanicola granulosus HTCC2516]